MRFEDLDMRWHTVSEEVMTGLTHRPTPPAAGTWARLSRSKFCMLNQQSS
jgi:hypothetical protein